MSTDIALVPDNIPAYLINKDLAAQLNADAALGIGLGMPPSIRMRQGKFLVVDADGTETILKPVDLDPSGEFLPIIVLAAKPSITKTFYATAYDPSQGDFAAPDCWSNDAITPDASVVNPQSPTCAGCPMNAFGSGKNAAGQPTKGKACADGKILAVQYRKGVYHMKIPPASLKNWGNFVKTLTLRGVPVNYVFVYVGFDEQADFPVYTFRVGGFIPEQHIPYVQQQAASDEVKTITHPGVATPAPAALPAAPAAPQIAPPPPPAPAPAADPSAAFFGGEETHKPIKSPGRPRKNPAPEAPAAAPAAPALPPAPAPAAVPGTPTDAELKAMLGL